MIKIDQDGTLDIAFGKHRNSPTWKNKETSWSELVQRVSKTQITHETHAEYIAAPISRQAEIKDMGGFVGGFLINGQRKAGNVMHRQLVCLDADHLTKGDFWGDFTALYGCAAAMYSTHKHTPVNPRLRLLIPLDRPVMRDEYEAIARRIASVLDINVFDDTTYQPNRLMYWPSTSKDGEFLFNYQDGTWLSADAVLASYTDWKDVSSWPVSDRIDKALAKFMGKQGDPLEKAGVIGAWCRTFSISEVIEKYLKGIYEPCDGIDDRYTYCEGSTAAGLVVYDDKFAYSHHGTDPISGKLCNSFDLVRIHKFIDKDVNASETMASNKLPSYLAMLDFATSVKQIKHLMLSEKIAEVKSDFVVLQNEDGSIDEEDADYDNAKWLELLDVDRKGNAYSTIDNILIVLQNDHRLRGRLAYNEFDKRETMTKNLPWRKMEGKAFLTDRDDAQIRHYLEKFYGLTGDKKIADALTIVMHQNSFHPVRKYLDALEWDGTERLDELLIDYQGAEDSAYTRAVTRKAFVAGVARVYVPGIKFDYVLTLTGKEGTGKSKIVDKMGGQWFTDSFTTVEGKDAYEQLQGAWLVEIAELSGLRNSDVNKVKHFVTKRIDRFRVSYGRRIEDFPRQCIFFGNTNEYDFLKGINGDRRFWPVKTLETTPIYSIDTDLTQDTINQLWAEAKHYFKEGEKLYLSKELEGEANEMQKEHSERDDRVGMVQAYLEKLLPENWDDLGIYKRIEFLNGGTDIGDDFAEGTVERQVVCIAEIWCEMIRGKTENMNGFNTKALHQIMKNMPGWERTKSNRNFKWYGSQKAYERVGAEEDGEKSVMRLVNGKIKVVKGK